MRQGQWGRRGYGHCQQRVRHQGKFCDGLVFDFDHFGPNFDHFDHYFDHSHSQPQLHRNRSNPYHHYQYWFGAVVMFELWGMSRVQLMVVGIDVGTEHHSHSHHHLPPPVPPQPTLVHAQMVPRHWSHHRY